MSSVAEKHDSPTLSRRDTSLFLLAAFVIATLHDVSGRQGLLALLDGIARQNLFFCLAVSVAAWRLWRSPATAASGFDYGLLSVGTLLFGFAAYLDQPMAAGLVLSLVVLAYATRGPDAEFHSGLIVMAALAVNTFWGPPIFQTFTDQVISIDVAALRMINAVLRPDVVSLGATFKGADGFAIIVIGACSVFNSASVAVLATTAFSQRFKAGLGARDVVAVATVLLVMLALNSARLAILGWSRANYDYWHSGAGQVWFSLGETLVVGAVAYACARWAARQ